LILAFQEVGASAPTFTFLHVVALATEASGLKSLSMPGLYVGAEAPNS
jgi:hypothetical protein